MYYYLVFLVILVCCNFANGEDLQKKELQFSEWCALYNKYYSSAEEANLRKQIFYNNAKLIRSLNNQYLERNVTFELNQFSDLTPLEFKSKVLMRPSPVPQLPAEVFTTPTPGVAPPDSFDWRERGVVTDVKDQGSVGSCWAFSTVGNIEGQWALKGKPLVSLSAELLVDCDAMQDPNSMNTDCGVFGGWPYLAYQYIMKIGGIESEKNYPYCSGFGQCFPCQAPGYNKTRCGPPVPETSCKKSESCLAKLNSSQFVPGLKLKSWIAIPQNETTIQQELIVRGPLSIAINAFALQFYHSGVWDPILPCDPAALDHAVLLVGYGTSHGLFGNKPYWLVKNSWGSKWGENGYFKLVRGKGKCGVHKQVTSVVL